MYKWLPVRDHRDLPKDRVFISLWKGRISLTEYDEDEDKFYIVFDPAQYEYSMPLDTDRIGKFTHWMELPNIPEDY